MRLVAEVWVLVERLLDRGPAVLPVVDHERRRHRDRQCADALARLRRSPSGSNRTSAFTDAVSAEKT